MLTAKRYLYLLFLILTLTACGPLADDNPSPDQNQPKRQADSGETSLRPQSIEELESGLAAHLDYDSVDDLFDYLDSLSEEEADSVLVDYLGFADPDEMWDFIDSLEETAIIEGFFLDFHLSATGIDLSFTDD